MLKPSAIVGSAFLFVSTVTLTDACPAQGGVVWTQSLAVDPPLRRYHTMAYDEARQQVVLFGGQQFGGVGYTDDTWVWDGIAWSQPPTITNRPPPASRPAMAYDPVRQVVVMSCSYGGQSNQTWEWNGSDWTQIQVPGPTGLRNSPVAFDPVRGEVLLFGGWNTVTAVFLDDTWAWDGSTWSQVPITGPPARLGAMATDYARNRVVLFGGFSYGLRFQDTWEWDGASWAQMPASGPLARHEHAMAYDPVRRRVVLCSGEGVNSQMDRGTWEWDGVNWVQVSATNPSGRLAPAMAYHTAQRELVLFGGNNPVLGTFGTWLCTSHSPADFTPFGSGCTGSVGVPTLNSAPFSSPWTGDPFSIELTNLPPGAMTFMVTGLSNTFWAGALIPLPAPLMSWGMPGCTVYTDVLNSELLVNTAGTATWSMLLPTNPLLVGLTFYNQGFVIDPGVNALGATVSNAGEATIGMR